ncbi:MAG TPA: histidine kinase N-terminal domain-containing protein [Acidimicrobiales bacterium]|nr:histidine kinase N-terminal domain-containing protein [Acidimicrobiales bacterium]
MTGLAGLTRSLAGLDGADVAHLHRLVASWGPLADLSFADLLLFVPLHHDASPAGDGRFVVVAQVRPTTSQTAYRHDVVGTVFDDDERPLVGQAFRSGAIVEGEADLGDDNGRLQVLSIPVHSGDRVVAVCTRESMPDLGRPPGELERTYQSVFRRFAAMIAEGSFPFAAQDAESEEAPRVGDGALVLDSQGRVTYASPNAVSALHRLKIHVNAEGERLADLGLEEVAVPTALAIGAPITEEIDRGPDVTVVLRCLPLLQGGQATGALLLLRDISELRRRDRLLVSMDATIREIHHRVKNNLQTISSLLRLQGRRLSSREARDAIEESVRRIRSIALVHETLSLEGSGDVPFNDIVRPLVRAVEESLGSPDRPIRFRVEGDAGRLPARVATPLAVVLTELLQNAADHAFPLSPGAPEARPEPAEVDVHLDNDGDRLLVEVADNGVGLPPGFRLEDSKGLGLSIVRSLVTSQIEGSISMDSPRADGRSGTVIEVHVPMTLAQHVVG